MITVGIISFNPNRYTDFHARGTILTAGEPGERHGCWLGDYHTSAEGLTNLIFLYSRLECGHIVHHYSSERRRLNA